MCHVFSEVILRHLCAVVCGCFVRTQLIPFCLEWDQERGTGKPGTGQDGFVSFLWSFWICENDMTMNSFISSVFLDIIKKFKKQTTNGVRSLLYQGWSVTSIHLFCIQAIKFHILYPLSINTVFLSAKPSNYYLMVSVLFFPSLSCYGHFFIKFYNFISFSWGLFHLTLMAAFKCELVFGRVCMEDGC